MSYTKTNWVNGETPINATNLNKIENQLEKLTNMIYPVGSIYMSVNNTNPSTLFGGTWEAWGTGRVPVGVDTSQNEFNAVEKTGGEKTHTLSVNEMPSHTHKQYTYTEGPADYASGSDWSCRCVQFNTNSGGLTSATGGNQPHNNLQPYITCYMWKRTA